MSKVKTVYFLTARDYLQSHLELAERRLLVRSTEDGDVYVIGNDDHAPASVGNKAFNLARMTRAGFPVPPGVCIGTEAFVSCLRDRGVTLDYLALACRVRRGDKQAISEADSIRAVIRQIPLPTYLCQNILTACASYRSLAERSGWIARSSSTLEDGLSTAFAGLFESVMGLYSYEQLFRGITQCWASAFNLRVLTYVADRRHILGFNQCAPLSVLLQPLIPAEKAGVAFSSHPVTGSNCTIVVESAWGLGDVVVGGRVTPDHFEVDKLTGRVITEAIGSKNRMLLANMEDLCEVETPPNLRQQSSINHGELSQIVGWTLKAEQLFEYPQDVEWLFYQNRVFVVQSRPISTLRAGPSISSDVV